jgi:hypothetical protein
MILALIFLPWLAVGPIERGAAQEREPAAAPRAFVFVPAGDSPFRMAERVVDHGLPESFDQAALLAPLDLPISGDPWLGSLTFGDIDSRRVAVVVVDGESPSLYVDLNRDQILTSNERLSVEQPGVWRCELDAEYLVDGGQREALPLQVQFRWQAASRQLRIATAGSRQGEVTFNNAPRAARYEDRDANGSWFDPDDRLFIDLDGDGKIDSITERLAGSGLRQLGGLLYAVGGDRTGRSLTLTEIRQRGRVLPQLTLKSPTAQITRLSATLVSQQGIRVDLTEVDLGQAVEVPIGQWQVSWVEVELAEAQQRYLFRFAAASRGQFANAVTADQETTMELLGDLRLDARVSVNRGAMTTLSIAPGLYSESGLYLLLSRVGRDRPEAENRLRSVSYGGTRYLGAGTAGFT